MNLYKSIKYEHYDSEAISVEVNLEKDDETPMKICMKGGEYCRWMTVEDAKGMVKAINAALKEIK